MIFLATVALTFVRATVALSLPLSSDLSTLAKQRKLAQSPPWRMLLHFPSSPATFADRSRVDSSDFFLSPEGRTNPEAELEATLARFFDEPRTPGVICRFPLRYQWLVQALDLDQASDRVLPLSALCPNLLRGEDITAVSLIFADSYLGNPASMFGHTFLKLSQRSPTDPTLLDTTVSFAADTQDDKGISFAFKGLTGGYDGRAFYAPYFVRLQRYGDIDKRDLWEFRLPLDSQQLDRLVLHLKELESAQFDYYFLDENCSYHVLALLDVSDPGFNLVAQSPWWVTPLDTIFLVLDAIPGSSVRYRPSVTSQLQMLEASLSSPTLLNAVQQIVSLEGPPEVVIRPHSAQERATILDAASVQLKVENLTTSERHRDLAETLLSLRSTIPIPAADTVFEGDPLPPSPAEAHAPRKFSLGVGLSQDQLFLEPRYRVAYHERGDPRKGFSDDSLTAFSASVRYVPRYARFLLQEVTLIEIESTPPRTQLSSPLSWQARLGARQFATTEHQNRARPEARAGIGVSYAAQGALLSTFLQSQAFFVDTSPSKLTAGIGPRVSLLAPLMEHTQLVADASFTPWLLDSYAPSFLLRSELHTAISKDTAVGIALSHERQLTSPFSTVTLGFHFFH